MQIVRDADDERDGETERMRRVLMSFSGEKERDGRRELTDGQRCPAERPMLEIRPLVLPVKGVQKRRHDAGAEKLHDIRGGDRKRELRHHRTFC